MHYGRAHRAASAPTPAHAGHTAHTCHTSNSTEAWPPDTLNTVTLQIRAFVPLLRNICSRNRIAHHFKLGSVHIPRGKKLLYLIWHQAVQREHCPNVRALQVPQVSQDGHVTQDAAVHSPERTTPCQGQHVVLLFRPHRAHSASYLHFTCHPCPRELWVDIEQLVLWS